MRTSWSGYKNWESSSMPDHETLLFLENNVKIFAIDPSNLQYLLLSCYSYSSEFIFVIGTILGLLIAHLFLSIFLQ